MEHKAKVGVVVPIWNVAPYIERCAESLMAQTLDDMQFVFVDDATPDNSIEILNTVLDRYPECKRKSMVVHHEVNKGLPTARKTGLEHINAEYVAHCDSDDWVEPTMYEKMYNSACSNNADLVVCEYFVGDRAYGIRYPKDGDMIRSYLQKKLPPYVWNRLTRTDIYRRVIFPKENYMEDWVQCVQTHAYSREVFFLYEPLYHNCINPSSVTKVNSNSDKCEKNLRQCMANMKLVHDFVISNQLADESDMVFMKIIVRNQLCPKLQMRQGRKEYLTIYPEVNRSLFTCRYLPREMKLEFIAIWLNRYPEWDRKGKYVYRNLKGVKRKLKSFLKKMVGKS